MRPLRGLVKNAPSIAAMAMLGIIVCYPLSSLIKESFLYDGAWSLENYRQIASNPANYVALFRTVWVSLSVTVLSTAIGTFLAWLIARTDFRGKERLKTWLMVPYLIPPFIGAFAWSQLFGPVGYANKLYQYITGATEPLFNIYGPVGIIIVLTVHSFPLVYLTSVGAFTRIDGALEEAAQVSGANQWTVLRDVTLPVLLPTILSGALLVFVSATANFGVPATLGFSSGFYVLTTRIFDAVSNFSLKNHFALAAALSVVLSFISGAGLLGANRLLRGKSFATIQGKGGSYVTVQLNKQLRSLGSAVMVASVFTAVAPLLAVVLTSVIRAYGLEPVPSNWTLQHYRYVLMQMPVARRALYNSIILALSAASVAGVCGALIAYVAQKSDWRKRSLLEFLATLPYAMPGTVVALAMILAYSKPVPFVGLQLYNTLGIILLAYIMRYLVFAVRSTGAGLSQVASTLEEAARTSGAGWAQAVRDVVFPLVRPSIVAGWFLVLMPAIHELTVSVLLWSVGNETLGVAVFNLQESGSVPATAALAIITICLVLVTNYIARRVAKLETGF